MKTLKQTTLYLPADLWQKVRIAAIQQNTTVRALVHEALERELQLKEQSQQ